MGGCVHGGLVYTSELDISCDALRYVEGVESHVAAVVVGEEPRADDGLCGCIGHTERGYDAVYLAADWCLWVCGERGAVVGSDAEDDGDLRGIELVITDAAVLEDRGQ